MAHHHVVLSSMSTLRQYQKDVHSLVRALRGIQSIGEVCDQAVQLEADIKELQKQREALMAEVATLRTDAKAQRDRLANEAAKAKEHFARTTAQHQGDLRTQRAQCEAECAQMRQAGRDDHDRSLAQAKRDRAALAKLKGELQEFATIRNGLQREVEEIRSRAERIRGLSA